MRGSIAWRARTLRRGGPAPGGGGLLTPKCPDPPVPLTRLRPHAALCRTVGTVAHAEIIRQSSGRSKGFAVVDFNSSADAQQVCRLRECLERRSGLFWCSPALLSSLPRRWRR